VSERDGQFGEHYGEAGERREDEVAPHPLRFTLRPSLSTDRKTIVVLLLFHERSAPC
jgi:hypothetical protein